MVEEQDESVTGRVLLGGRRGRPLGAGHVEGHGRWVGCVARVRALLWARWLSESVDGRRHAVAR